MVVLTVLWTFVTIYCIYLFSALYNRLQILGLQILINVRNAINLIPQNILQKSITIQSSSFFNNLTSEKKISYSPITHFQYQLIKKKHIIHLFLTNKKTSPNNNLYRQTKKKTISENKTIKPKCISFFFFCCHFSRETKIQ